MDNDDIFPDYEDIRDHFRRQRMRATIVIERETTEYGEGMWKGKQIKDLETSHISNIIDMLIRRGNSGDEERQLGREAKIKELKAELQKRRDAGEVIQHSRHKIVITEGMIRELVKQQGAKLPKSGGGVYLTVGKNTFRMKDGQVEFRFDTQKILQEAENVSRKGAGRRRRK